MIDGWGINCNMDERRPPCALDCNSHCILAFIIRSFIQEDERVLIEDPKALLDYLREAKEKDCHLEGLDKAITELKTYYKTKNVKI